MTYRTRTRLPPPRATYVAPLAIPAAAAAPLDAAPLAAGIDRAADVGRAGRQRVPSLAVALLAVARLAAGIRGRAAGAERHLPPRLFL